MKKFLATLLMLMTSSMALAGSIYDGFYYCRVAVPGIGQTLDAYAVFLAHDDGVAAMSFAAPVSPSVVGYSIGRLSGTSYTGNDATGRQVAFTLSTGTVTINDYYLNNGTPYPATYSCNKVF